MDFDRYIIIVHSLCAVDIGSLLELIIVCISTHRLLLVFRNGPGALHRVEPGSKPPAGLNESYLDEKDEQDRLLSERSQNSTTGYGGTFPYEQTSIQYIEDT